MKTINYKNVTLILLYTILTAMLFAVNIIMPIENNLALGAVYIIYAVACYFYIVYFIANRNWMDIRAVFSGVWILTVGLAVLRLAGYQTVWEDKTWWLHIIAFVLFQLGSSLGMYMEDYLHMNFKNVIKKISNDKIKFTLKEDRLFYVCVITTLLGLTCFLINVYIRGFIPCFSNSITAYRDFYTKFHVFAVATTIISGLCVYCIGKLNISLFKKIVLGMCAFYNVILFPILVVSRGVFMVSALSFLTATFYTFGKKLRVLIISILLIFSVYLGMSNLRDYTADQMNLYFEPSEIIVEGSNNEMSDGNGVFDFGINLSFKLPPKVAFLYSYLTVSHDNFNLAVKNTSEYTWGALQFKPFNVILRIDFVDKIIDEKEWYQVNPYLNTTNFLGGFYSDFHEYGIIFFVFLWSFIFGVIQSYYEETKSCFALLTLGNTMTPVALSFFGNWMSDFTLWMHWGTILILYLVCNFLFVRTDY